MKFRLLRVHYMPKQLEAGVLYVSDAFGAAAHLCACGCGCKIRTPLGPTDWSVTDEPSGPTLFPSVGNWQRACRSHYWIRRGEVRWAPSWTEEEVLEGRQAEQARTRAYYESLDRSDEGWLRRAWRRLRRLR